MKAAQCSSDNSSAVRASDESPNAAVSCSTRTEAGPYTDCVFCQGFSTADAVGTPSAAAWVGVTTYASRPRF